MSGRNLDGNNRIKLLFDTRLLLHDYCSHLKSEEYYSFSKRAAVLRTTKSDAMNDICNRAAHLVKPKLDTQVTINQKTMSYAALLSMRRTNRFYLALQIIIIALTFPLSVPILMLWSAVKRQTYRFWKTDGALLVERLPYIPPSSPPAAGSAACAVAVLEVAPPTTHVLSTVDIIARTSRDQAHTSRARGARLQTRAAAFAGQDVAAEEASLLHAAPPLSVTTTRANRSTTASTAPTAMIQKRLAYA
jgi:hypothetical protein